ncbi:MAG TPA: hypothetical protein VFF28_03885 [Candidatus Nanoarchaeia archaeon]|nr:hypothetical protein [Candidatus Nanoarchaeia archaeon]
MYVARDHLTTPEVRHLFNTGYARQALFVPDYLAIVKHKAGFELRYYPRPDSQVYDLFEPLGTLKELGVHVTSDCSLEEMLI